MGMFNKRLSKPEPRRFHGRVNLFLMVSLHIIYLPEKGYTPDEDRLSLRRYVGVFVIGSWSLVFCLSLAGVLK
jgi:hypothetical protein